MLFLSKSSIFLLENNKITMIRVVVWLRYDKVLGVPFLMDFKWNVAIQL